MSGEPGSKHIKTYRMQCQMLDVMSLTFFLVADYAVSLHHVGEREKQGG